MSGTKRWIKIIVVSLLIGVLLGGGITIARLFFPAAPEKLLNRGEKAYAQGEEALKAGDGVTAAARFEEANLQANKALDAMERERHKDSNRNAEAQASLARLEGEGLWLKSRALRDSYFAHALAQGRPFPDTTDPISGVKFRSLLYIPDPKTLHDVLEYQRNASFLLSDNAELARQALITETMLPALDWAFIEKLARQNLQHNAKDPWALYLLARFEYEQPSTAPTGGTPVPPGGRRPPAANTTNAVGIASCKLANTSIGSRTSITIRSGVRCSWRRKSLSGCATMPPRPTATAATTKTRRCVRCCSAPRAPWPAPPPARGWSIRRSGTPRVCSDCTSWPSIWPLRTAVNPTRRRRKWSNC